jgi:hypothetical protein
MKSFAALMTLLLCLPLAATATGYDPSLELRQLPEGAMLKVKKDIQLEDTWYNEFEIDHTGFENGKQVLDADVNDFCSSFNSQVIVRTNTHSSVYQKTVSHLFYNSSAMFLESGEYCLSRSESKFDSAKTGYVCDAQDYLYFRRCDSGEAAFVIYAIAGYSLRNGSHYRAFTLRDFDFHTGKVMEFTR